MCLKAQDDSRTNEPEENTKDETIQEVKHGGCNCELIVSNGKYRVYLDGVVKGIGFNFYRNILRILGLLLKREIRVEILIFCAKNIFCKLFALGLHIKKIYLYY